MPRPLSSVAPETLQERLVAADSPRAAVALQAALAAKDDVPVETIAGRVGVPEATVREWFDAIATRDWAALEGRLPNRASGDARRDADGTSTDDDGSGATDPGTADVDGRAPEQATGSAVPATGGDADLGGSRTGNPATPDWRAALGDAAPFPLVGMTPDGTVTAWNDAAEGQFGWTESEVLGRPAPFLAAETPAAWRPLWNRLMDGESVADETLGLQRVDGTDVEVTVFATPVTADGTVRGATLALLDRTERREHEQQLDVLNRVLRHNLRNDVTAILGHVEKIRVSATDEEVIHSAERIRDVARSLSEVSEKARRIATELERRRPLEMLDLVHVVEPVVDRARDDHPAVDIRTDLPDAQVALATESLGLALEALIENAVVHADGEAPTVRVSVAQVRDDGRRWIELTVADDGPGIPVEEQAVLEEGSESPLQHGSGLGLWFVHWIVDRCDGELVFDDSALGGAAVRVRLQPVSRSAGP